MEPKICLLVVENRDSILLAYMKHVLFLVTNNKVQRVRFWHMRQRKQIWHMRREMIRAMLLETDCTHALFLDTDVIPENDAVDKLKAHNLPIVSGFYCDQEGNPAIRKDGEKYIGKALEPVDVLSMGFSLIRRDVLEAVEYPMPDPPQKLDGDTEFCQKVKEAGFQPMTDFTLRGNHLLLASF